MPRFVLSAFIALGCVELAAIGLAGSRPAPQEYAIVQLSEAPEALRATIDTAEQVFTEIRKAHVTEITRALANGGPGGAIGVCHQSSAAVIERVKREKGFEVGRTSDRLRNPTNLPRPWMTATIAKYAGARAASVEGFYVDLGDRIGVMRPIAEESVCGGCHGPADRLEPRVRQELRERYPADRATGFKTGEIRGWLWAEVPVAK
ncbi:MAG TPA: DUF3365 domain-containing protein [Vicinamibacterales bacterium]